jgi:hypothetical protein
MLWRRHRKKFVSHGWGERREKSGSLLISSRKRNEKKRIRSATQKWHCTFAHLLMRCFLRRNADGNRWSESHKHLILLDVGRKRSLTLTLRIIGWRTDDRHCYMGCENILEFEVLLWKIKSERSFYVRNLKSNKFTIKSFRFNSIHTNFRFQHLYCKIMHINFLHFHSFTRTWSNNKSISIPNTCNIITYKNIANRFSLEWESVRNCLQLLLQLPFIIQQIVFML